MTGSGLWTTCPAQWASSNRPTHHHCQVTAHPDLDQMTGRLGLDQSADLVDHPEDQVVVGLESRLQRELGSKLVLSTINCILQCDRSSKLFQVLQYELQFGNHGRHYSMPDAATLQLEVFSLQQR